MKTKKAVPHDQDGHDSTRQAPAQATDTDESIL